MFFVKVLYFSVLFVFVCVHESVCVCVCASGGLCWEDLHVDKQNKKSNYLKCKCIEKQVASQRLTVVLIFRYIFLLC